MAQIIDIDPAVLRHRHQNFHLEGGSQSPGAGLDGREQIVIAEDRRWVGEIEFVPQRREQIAALNALGDRLQGRANALRLCVDNFYTITYAGDPDAFLAAAGVTSQQLADGFIKFSDGATFDDGSGFALPDYNEPSVAADATAGASEILLDGYIGGGLKPGAFFSIDDFLYRVAINANGLVQFNPPLRASVLSGDVVQVTMPKVLVRLASHDGWRQFVELGQFGRALSVDVVEAFDR